MKNLRLIYKLAWSFHYTTNIELDELIGELSLLYAEALNEYDSSKKVKFTTFAYSFMRNGIINYLKKQKQQKMVYLDDLSYFDTKTSQSCTFDEMMEIIKQWPEANQELIEFVLDNFDELDEMPPKFARGAIVRELREKGWKWQNIWDTMNETKVILKNTSFIV